MSSKTRNKIIQCAKDHNGTHEGFGQGELKPYRSETRKFLVGSQMRAVFTNDKGEDKADKLYVGGICHTMSLYWLGHKTNTHIKKPGSKEVQNFWDWLKPNGNFEEAAANVLILKTVMYKAKGEGSTAAGIVKDSGMDDRFFLKYGLKRSVKKLNNAFQIGYAMHTTDMQFVMISYSGDASGHACALFNNHARVIYFDPNYGEFSFRSSFDAYDFYNDYLDVSKYRTKYKDVTGTIYTY